MVVATRFVVGFAERRFRSEALLPQQHRDISNVSRDFDFSLWGLLLDDGFVVVNYTVKD